VCFCVDVLLLLLMVACLHQALLKFMHTYKDTAEQFTYMSSSLYWTSAYVLADLLVSAGG
jgi:hypothetical protein